MEIDPFGIGLALQGVKSLAGIGQFIAGKAKQNKIEDIKYTRPEEAVQAENLARSMAREGMTAEAEQMGREGIGTSMATALKYGGGNNVADIARQASKGYMQMAAEDEQIRRANQRNLQGQLMQSAQYSDREWEENVLRPYEEQTAEAQALMGSGLQNIFGGVDAMGSMMQTKATYDGMSTSLFGDSESTGDAGGQQQPTQEQIELLKKIFGGANMTNLTGITG